MVTSCAVNLGHYKRQSGAESTAEAEMRRRIELVIRLAASQGSEVHTGAPDISAEVFPGACAGCLGLWGFPVAPRHCGQVGIVQLTDRTNLGMQSYTYIQSCEMSILLHGAKPLN